MRVANAEMVRALRVMTVERGIDPRRFALLAFGGAGPLHAAAIAEELGMTRILVPRASGVLSALGLAAADRRADAQRTVLGDDDASVDALADEVRAALGGEPADRGRPGTCATAASRTSSPSAARERDELRERFEALHEERYGHRDPDGEVELVTVRVTGRLPAPPGRLRRAGAASGSQGPPSSRCPRRRSSCPRAGAGRTDDTGTLVLERRMSVDPIALQVTAGALRAACEEMGAVLVRSAHSANIKERRDCSTALFDAAGEMVMQAEHIPVHLGAMPAAVAAVRDRDHAPDVSWVLNDPYAGGTHLPDITVVTPAFHDGELLGFAAARAHHADVGGRVPGSMPADSTHARGGGRRHRAARPRRRGDRRARRRRCASPRSGAPTCAPSSPPTAPAPGGSASWPIASGWSSCARRPPPSSTTPSGARARAWRSSTTATRTAVDLLEAADGDLELRVAATVAGDELTLDFSGSAAQHAGNLNCPLAVTASACLFAVRVLTDPDIPPSAGAYRPITVHRARGLAAQRALARRGRRRQRRDLLARGRPRARRLRPRARPGHDEQPHARHRRVDLLRDARRRPGRVPGRRRARARVHVAMSNTLNTPVEALELEFPLRVTEYALRRGSGGAGRHRGGDGVVRELAGARPT